MVIKTWSVKSPLIGAVLVASAFSQTAKAAELPASQTLPTPGIPTPDQAVRRMATNVVLDSRSAAALSEIPAPNATKAGVDRTTLRSTTSRPIAPLPLTAGLPNPSGVLSSCPANVCGLVATQPPVVLGTATPSGISKNEQSRLTELKPSTSSTIPKITIPKVETVPPEFTTPSDQITSAAKISLSTEPGLSKDVAFGQPTTKSAKPEQSTSKFNSPAAANQEAANQPQTTSTVARVNTADQAIGFGNVQNQITSFTGQLVASSWKLITVLPKPQLDSSLLNIGSNRLSQQADALSFSPRLTLGTAVEPVFPTKISSSWSALPLFTAHKLVAKPVPAVIQWDKSSFFAQPWSQSNSQLDKMHAYTGFSQLDRFETLAKPFNIMTFLATVNTSTLSSNQWGGKNY